MKKFLSGLALVLAIASAPAYAVGIGNDNDAGGGAVTTVTNTNTPIAVGGTAFGGNSVATGGAVSNSGNSTAVGVGTGGSVTNSGNSTAVGLGGNATATGGQGGLGVGLGVGIGGEGGSVLGSGNSTNTNANTNIGVNSSTNTNNIDNTVRNTVGQDQSQGQGQQQGQGQSQKTDNANNSKQTTNVNVAGDNVKYEAARIPASTAVAPTMFATAMCQAARAGAFQNKAFGISMGGTITDENCIRLEQFRVVTNVIRDPETINSMACLASPLYRQARKDMGLPCASDVAPVKEEQKTVAVEPSKAFGQP